MVHSRILIGREGVNQAIDEMMLPLRSQVAKLRISGNVEVQESLDHTLHQEVQSFRFQRFNCLPFDTTNLKGLAVPGQGFVVPVHVRQLPSDHKLPKWEDWAVPPRQTAGAQYTSSSVLYSTAANHT